MGLFGKKNGQSDEKTYKKSEELVLKEALVTEVESLQKEFRAKQEEIESVTKKLQSVKEEYDIATGNLMSVKKESNQKKMELDMTYLEYKDVKSKINDADEKFNKNKKLIEEVNKAETNLTIRKQDLEKIKKEYDEIKEKITIEQSSLHEIRIQQIQAKRELDEINSRIYNTKQESGNPQQSNLNETDIFTFKEKEFIAGESASNRETKGIIEAASVIVGSIKSKLSMTEKELETVQILLEKERNDHIQTKNELEKLKRRSE